MKNKEIKVTENFSPVCYALSDEIRHEYQPEEIVKNADKKKKVSKKDKH